MSEDFFRFTDVVTVRTLLVDTTLACLECDLVDEAGDVSSLIFMVASASSTLESDIDSSSFGGTGGGTADFLDVVLLVAVDTEDTDDTDERIDVLDGARLASTGESFLLSTGDGGGRLPFVVETLETVEGALERTILGEEDAVAAERTLVVDAEDMTRDRAAELGVRSDLAVSKFVDPSLVMDVVELGRDNPEGGRKFEGPAIVLRMVEACDLVDLVEAADDRKRGDTSFTDALDARCLRDAGAGFGAEVEVTESRTESRMDAREVQEAIRVTEEKLKVLRQVIANSAKQDKASEAV